MKKIFSRWLVSIWYKDPFFAVWLKPFSMIYHDIVKFRRFLYRFGLFKSRSLTVPVIVVGNITVGGTGKTPFIIWLTAFLQQTGLRPGIISRGYLGEADNWPQCVNADSDPQMVGDEAVLLAKNCSCPVAVGPSRIESALLLMENNDCDLILSDDGLQHYALNRDLEIAVVDGVRRFGNGAFLPGGPLREPISRLQEVDLVVCNGGEPEENEYSMRMVGDVAINLANGEQKKLQQFTDQTCHALAAIGNPQGFFTALKQAGINCVTHYFPDHYAYRRQDVEFNDALPVLMTEKDAVKCTGFASDKHWYVPVQAVLQDDFKQKLLSCVDEISGRFLS